MFPTTRRANDQGRFGITAALGVSVLLHMLLIVLGWLVPFDTRPREPLDEETTLRFDLTPMEEVTRQSTTEPRGQVPVPVPPTPARQTPPDSREAVDPLAVPPSPAALPPAVEELLPDEAEESTEAEDSEAGLELPGDGTLAEGARDDSAPARTASPRQQRFNVEDALRDFGRALEQPRPESRDPQRGLNVPDLPPLPATGFGFGNLEFESRDYDWSDYARQIYMAIWRSWHNRLYVTSEAFERWGYESRSWQLRHANRITFTIERNGQVTGIALETPSGCYPLDDSALDALREVILPPLPSDFPRGREKVHARFIAEGDVRTMRSYLGMLKRAGYF